MTIWLFDRVASQLGCVDLLQTVSCACFCCLFHFFLLSYMEVPLWAAGVGLHTWSHFFKNFAGSSFSSSSS
jgi:hypothetical protein